MSSPTSITSLVNKPLSPPHKKKRDGKEKKRGGTRKGRERKERILINTLYFAFHVM